MLPPHAAQSQKSWSARVLHLDGALPLIQPIRELGPPQASLSQSPALIGDVAGMVGTAKAFLLCWGHTVTRDWAPLLIQVCECWAIYPGCLNRQQFTSVRMGCFILALCVMKQLRNKCSTTGKKSGKYNSLSESRQPKTDLKLGLGHLSKFFLLETDF